VGSVTAGNSQIQTQIFPLNFENANNLVPVLRPLISPNNTINVNPGNNSLIITDYADNLQRIARIVAALDVSNASDVEIIGLKHALASDLAPLVLKLIESGGTPAAAGAGQADTSFKTTLVAEPRSNSLILRAANPARVALVKSLVSKLDQPGNTSNGGAGNIYVVHLKNADATKLAVTLRAALSAEARPNTGGVTTTPSITTPATAAASSGLSTGSTLSSGSATTATQPSTGGQIQADPATNTLIITAPEPQYRQLRAVIEKLDGRRAQVYVESLIAEVNADRAADFGVQWQSPVGSNGSGVIGLLGTNFSASVAGANIISLATGAASGSTLPATGGNIGLMQRVNGRYVLGALARFIETTGDGNVLSTPNLLTLDNEEARIVVGENRPFVTGQFTNTGTTGGTVSPFQTIERKDVGLTLKVKPQISENGTIKLQVFQEVSDVQASTVNDSKGPTTNKRSIESTVLVEDGGVVVLGGLLKDNYSGNLEKVPGLGDIPIIGNLFKSQSRTRSKTNLMVFLRPVVLRDAAAADALSQDRYEQMRTIQQGMQPTATPVLPLAGAAILPSPMGAAPATPAAAEANAK
jgi:general secretion pathway protein D